MIRLAPALLEIGLLIFCVIDVIQTDEFLIRNLQNKVVWIMLIIFLPIIGSVAWLVAGRPWQPRTTGSVPWRATATAGFPEYERPMTQRRVADIDDQLRRDQERVDREHEDALRRWEASLRERERKLSEGDAGASAG